jgi:cation diffusion facilitator CzcD-associated flavoprotein CzcO
MHSHHYLGDDPAQFAGKRVVVLGMGNSAMDIAVEATQTAERVFLAARRGAWIVPKYVFGRPLDQFVTAARVPLAVRQRFMETTLRAAVGTMERYGLPKPDHRPLEAHPTISDTILTRLTHGDITPKPNIARLTATTVVFTDGSEEPADIVIYGTGYKVSFPFFDPGLVSAPDNDLPLYRRVFHPDLPGLYFIALLQPLGATMPLAEAQSEWVCDHLTGRYALPPRAEIAQDIARERAAMRRRYVASKRHTMQVDYDDYMYALKQERKRGAKRAAS